MKQSLDLKNEGAHSELQHMIRPVSNAQTDSNNFQNRLSALEDKVVAREHLIDSDMRSLKEAIVSITETLLSYSEKRPHLKSHLEYPKKLTDA